MNSKTLYNWTKENLLNFLAGHTAINDGKRSIETFSEHDSLMSVTVRSEDRSPIVVEMNGKEVEAEVVLFTLK